MTISKEQFDDLLIRAKPVVDWLRENIHPHAYVTIDCGRVELVEGIAASPIALPEGERGEG